MLAEIKKHFSHTKTVTALPECWSKTSDYIRFTRVPKHENAIQGPKLPKKMGFWLKSQYCRKKKRDQIRFFFRYVFFFVKNCILKNTGFETVSGLVRPKNTSFVHKNSKITNLTKYFDHFQPQIFWAFFGLSWKLRKQHRKLSKSVIFWKNSCWIVFG